MFIEAAHAVADQVSEEQLKSGMLFPPQSNVLEVAIHTAVRVAKLVYAGNLAGVPEPQDLEAFIRSLVYAPVYPSLTEGAGAA